LGTRQDRLLYTRAARARLQALPAEVRLHLETHMANLALLVEGLAPERLPQLLAHEDESFVTAVPGARVLFVVAPTARALLVHRIEALPEREAAAAGHAPLRHE
jgi:hypothetical protein